MTNYDLPGHKPTPPDHTPCPGTDWKDCVEIAVFQGDVWDCDFWNMCARGSLMLFQGWLAEQVAKIPPEYVSSADFRIDSEGGYEGEHHATISVSYWRPMTEHEKAMRADEKLRREQARDDEDRRRYQILKAKFSDGKD